MNDRDRDELTPELERVRDTVRDLGTPQADPDFKDRLMHQFVAGDFEEADETAALTLEESTRRVWFGGVGFALAAALAFVIINMNQLPGPTLLALGGTGDVIIDGQVFQASQQDEIANALEPGALVELNGPTHLDVLYEGTLALRLESNAAMVLPERPKRWGDVTQFASLSSGEICIRTGPNFEGRELRVETSGTEVVVAGTLVSVFSNSELVCVCLVHGSATAHCDDGDLGEVPASKRWVVFNDDRDPALMDIEPLHQAHLLAFDTAMAQEFGRH